ncbi:MAG: circadian clock KaiB family protein [Pseudomonadota bacterium]
MNEPPMFKFRLYVAGDTQNSMQALANLTKICQTYLVHSHEIEVLDVFKEPDLTLKEGVFMTPTLVKLSPSPMIKIVGTLSQTQIILQALGLDTPSA